MARLELLTIIVRLRSEMNGMVSVGVDYTKVIEVCQEIDKFIVLYQKTAMLKAAFPVR